MTTYVRTNGDEYVAISQQEKLNVENVGKNVNPQSAYEKYNYVIHTLNQTGFEGKENVVIGRYISPVPNTDKFPNVSYHGCSCFISYGFYLWFLATIAAFIFVMLVTYSVAYTDDMLTPNRNISEFFCLESYE